MLEKERNRIFETEMTIHYKSVYKFLLRLCGEVERAENLTQDTYARAFVKLDKYEEGSSSRSWLFKVAYNLFVSDYRKQQKRGETNLNDGLDYGQDEEVGETVAFSLDPEMLGNVFSDEVQQALLCLSPKQREILLRADLFDFSEKELAEEMGITLNTVKSRTRRARINVIKSLEGFAKFQYGISNTRNLE